ncbi:MAG: thioredoxin [Lachnospiraceae bacterium]|nr:thioredoxin [Lachnospiraceae bacterium]
MREKTRTGICIMLIVLGISMIGIGVADGEVKTVLQKSVNICLECIGIG